MKLTQLLEKEEGGVISAGFAIKSLDQYLFGKAYSKNTAKSWAIFKGNVEKDETLLEAAIRELREESGIDANYFKKYIKGNKPIFSYPVKTKVVHVFMLESSSKDLQNVSLKCVSKITGTKIPEITAYSWMNLDEALNKVYPSQLGLIRFLMEQETEEVEEAEK